MVGDPVCHECTTIVGGEDVGETATFQVLADGKYIGAEPEGRGAVGAACPSHKL